MAAEQHQGIAPRVSVLQLDTRFARIPGDVACPESYRTPPEILRVPRATVDRIVTDRPDGIDIHPFAKAVTVAKGDVITTSCGFLAPLQSRLSAHTARPVVASSLGALAWLSQSLRPDQILIVTFDAIALALAHFGPWHAYCRGVVGLPATHHLRRVISKDAPDLDPNLAEREIAQLIQAQLTPQHRHILLECTNLPPYKSAIRSVTGLPVTDILTEIERVQPGAIAPRWL